MPRLPRALLLRAFIKNPLLPTLLKECRTLEQATVELRWLREYALEEGNNDGKYLTNLCSRRGRGEPLQYLLGTQPFGGLEILCRKGVLIPRPETEHLASHLFTHLSNAPLQLPTPLHILDLCTGTGCIPLYLYQLLHGANIPARCTGLDISPTAICLARRNRAYNITAGVLPDEAQTHVAFGFGDVMKAEAIVCGRTVDVVVANPPYIGTGGFDRETSRSVRNYEPRSALVPEGGDADAFYPEIGWIARSLGAKVLLVEVGGWGQAEMVKTMWVQSGNWDGVGIWGDYAGKGRGVVAWRKGWEWVEKGPEMERVRQWQKVYV